MFQKQLKQLYMLSSEGRPGHEKKVIPGLFKRYENTFSKSEWEIG